MRINISLTNEQYLRIKELSGITPVSAFIRAKVFGGASEAAIDSNMREWVDALLKIPRRVNIMEKIKARSKEGGMSVDDIISRRIDQ